MKKKADGNTLTMILNGVINTMTAFDLEKEIQGSIEGVENLVFDFNGIKYISSAGLRVLLHTQKAMGKRGSMLLKGVNDKVNEIFEITGFDDVFTIE